MPTTQNIVIDLNTRGAAPVAFTHQGDTARTFVFEVYNNGEEFDVSSYSVKVAALLPADNGYYVIAGENMATGDTYGNTITVTLPAEYTQKFGNGVLTLVLTGSGATIRPINVDLRIQKSADAPETIAGASDFAPVLERYMAEDMQTYINAWLDAHPEAMQYYISGSKLVLDENGILSIQNDTDEIVEALDLDTLRSEVSDLKSDIINISTISEEAHALASHISETLNPLLSTGDVYMVDNSGNHLVDSYTKKLVRKVFLFNTDKTLKESQIPADAKATGEAIREIKENMGISFTSVYLDTGLPVVYLNHPDILSLKTKADGELKNVEFKMPAFGIYETLKKIKVQGASSQAYPKKNYTLTFSDNVTVNSSWGAHKKYVIKADWVDFSHMRNVFGAKMWGAIRKNRIDKQRNTLTDGTNYLSDAAGNHLVGETIAAFSMGMNYGAIDGFPICVVINGNYWGLYSFNIPKDDWMAGMIGASQKECIVSAENHSTATAFRGKVSPLDGDEMKDLTSDVVAFSLEYTSDEDNVGWISTSINNAIEAVMNSYQSDVGYEDAISQYIDIDSAIDYYILACIINHGDGTDKNYLLETWDGLKWFFAAYDMDATFGNMWNGMGYDPIKGGVTFLAFSNASRLMYVIKNHMTSKLKARYKTLRSGVLSNENIFDMIYSYAIQIPKSALDYECKLWPSRPGTNTNNIEQIATYYTMRANYLDLEMEDL